MFRSVSLNKNIVIVAAAVVCLLAAGFRIVSTAGESEYNSYGRRDPFVPLVGVSTVTASGGLRGIVSVDDLALQGIVIGRDGKRAAIINGEVFKEGYTAEGVEIISIGASSIKIKINNNIHDLELYK